MQILDKGHSFLLDILDYDGRGEVLNTLEFVKREGEMYPGNVGKHPGTNLQEVYRACISRLIYLDNQISDPNNQLCIEFTRLCIAYLEYRAARRHGRELLLNTDELEQIETLETCPKCGHIKPELHTECLAR